MTLFLQYRSRNYFYFTGLKVLIVCFEDRLATEWYRIYQALETVVDSRIGENVLFSFCLRVSFLRVGGWMLHGERENEK